MEELEKKSDILSKDTEEILVYNMPNMNDNNSDYIVGKKINFEKLYGKLEKR